MRSTTMADAQSAPRRETPPSQQIPSRSNPLQVRPPSSVGLPPPSSADRIRNSYKNLDTFSPVNQNGSFEFDRVLKSGFVNKRTRKTKAWKPIFLVLRPNSLSIYRDQHEDKLRHKIHLADLTAVSFLKDSKQKREHLFGLFSPSRNYHLEAKSKKDVEEWVSLIRREARIEEEEEEMLLQSPVGASVTSNSGFDRAMQRRIEQRRIHDERLGSSSPEPSEPVHKAQRPDTLGLAAPRRPSHTVEYSGNELASHSDMSDMELSQARGHSRASIPEEPLAVQAPLTTTMVGTRNVSQMSGINVEQDTERVIWQGHLLWLKSLRGVRQWKESWVVVRQKNIGLYKTDAEYSPSLIIPLSAVINAVEVDPISKTKTHCLQIITEEKSYKFCAPNEDALDKSLGAIKSLVAKRRP